jgi:hypothetical protein
MAKICTRLLEHISACPPLRRPPLALTFGVKLVGRAFMGKKVCARLATIRPDLTQIVPIEERGETIELWAYSNSGSLEVNFHDVDAPQATEHGDKRATAAMRIPLI